MRGRGPIWSPLLGSTGPGSLRPVQLAGARPHVWCAVGELLGEEIEIEGLICKLSATRWNSDQTHLQLVKTPRAFLRNFHRGRGRSPVPCVTGPSGPDVAQYYS
jgi:hypothetical protein